MTQPGRDDPERLIVAWNFSANALEVFKELRDPMRQAARRGLRFVLSQAPNEGDVDDVVTRAFSEVLKDISDEVKRDPVAFAKVVAHRRGVDRGRVIIREREKIKDLVREVERHRVTGEDLAAAAARERRLRAAEQAMSELTAQQRDVIERTVMGQESLSDWTLERGTSYEAGRRLRARGLEALRKQIEGSESGRPEGRNADG
jgi:DNA-directed RNA polymerase specialized sigma24 family protein